MHQYLLHLPFLWSAVPDGKAAGRHQSALQLNKREKQRKLGRGNSPRPITSAKQREHFMLAENGMEDLHVEKQSTEVRSII